MVKNIDQFIAGILGGFNAKQQRVLSGRFGLKNGVRATLQEIGDELRVTRERVRQIEEQATKKLKDIVRTEAADLIAIAEAHLAASGDIREDKLFLDEVYKKAGFSERAKYLHEKLSFVFTMAGSPLYHKEDDSFRAFWYTDKKSEKKFFDFITEVAEGLRSGDKMKAFKKKEYAAMCPDFHSCHLLSIPKIFGTNVFGDFGLREWAEIEPKTIRDKAYLVLKKNEKPLHFNDIARNIQKLGIDKKPAHVQTVHNELIKDGRFVLVGRGMYALQEHGYESGTVKEVIGKLLHERGPLSSDEVVRLVNERRFLKENTILLNLQNRKHFKRLEDGTYHIKEA
jgi:predicted Zn-ribbon and HTH transcriptional regulator